MVDVEKRMVIIKEHSPPRIFVIVSVPNPSPLQQSISREKEPHSLDFSPSATIMCREKRTVSLVVRISAALDIAHFTTCRRWQRPIRCCGCIPVSVRLWRGKGRGDGERTHEAAAKDVVGSIVGGRTVRYSLRERVRKGASANHRHKGGAGVRRTGGRGSRRTGTAAA